MTERRSHTCIAFMITVIGLLVIAAICLVSGIAMLCSHHDTDPERTGENDAVMVPAQ